MEIFRYNLKDDITQLKNEFLTDMCHIVSTDVESSGLNQIFDKPFLIVFSWLKPKQYVKSFTFTITDETLKIYQELVAMSHIKYHFMWNGKFDLGMFLNINVNLLHLDNLYEGMTIPHLAISSYDKRVPAALKLFARLYLDPNAANLQDNLKEELKRLTKDATNSRDIALQTYTKTKLWKAETITKAQQDALIEDTIPQDILEEWEKIKLKYPMPGYLELDSDLLEKYACEDGVLPLLLVNKFLYKLVHPDSPRFQLTTLKRESNVMKVLSVMEKNGMCIDKDYLLNAKNTLKQLIIDSYKELWDLMGIKLKVGQQVKIIEWFAKNKTPLWDRVTHTINAQDDTLLLVIETLKDYPAKDEIKKQNTIRVCKLIRKLRSYTKWYSTYITKYLEECITIDNQSYVLGSFNSFGTKTGRFSSSWQQFPNGGITNCYCTDNSKAMCTIPEHLVYKPRAIVKSRFKDGYLCFLDYSQIELRAGADQTLQVNNPDKDWLNSFYNYYNTLEWNPVDMHTNTAEKIFKTTEKQDPITFKKYRSLAKTINFTILYGGGPGTINTRIYNNKDFATATMFYNTFRQTYPGFVAFQKWCYEEVVTKGIVVNNFGRVYHWNSPSKETERTASSCMIQGVCADFLKDRLYAVQNYLLETKSNIKIINLVHDEIAFDVPKDEIDKIIAIQKIMEYNTLWTVPIVCEIEISTTNWAEKRKVKTIQDKEIIWN